MKQTIKNKPNASQRPVYNIHTLSNGIRVVHKQSSSPVAHCGIIINTGSRDESPEEQGIAHFIEHVIFKGTTNRKAFHILSYMENVGGELNAYTSKEETAIYASFMTPYYSRCLELLSDITFNSVFPLKEIEKEKDVVIDEINSYKDTPSEQIMDDFDELIFKDHPMGMNILGTPANLKKFSRNTILDFMDRTYATDQMALCSVGNIEFSQLVKMAEKYFGDFPYRPRKSIRIPIGEYQSSQKINNRRNHQTHCVLGNRAYENKSDWKTALILLNNILGGPGLNSRLNLNIREKYGFCYTIESNYQPYTDTGIFSIYLGTDKDHLEKTIWLVNRELEKLRSQKLGVLQLKRAKQQLMGQVAISFDSNQNEMLSIGKSILVYDKIDSLEEIYQKIEVITEADLLQVANEVFEPSALSMLVFKPR